MPLFFILHKLQFHANKVTIHSFLKIHVYLHLLILLCKNPLWYGILCWFFVTTAHQYITFMFLITTKQVQNSVKVSALNSRYLWEKFPKIGLTSYVDNTVASLPRHGHRDVRSEDLLKLLAIRGHTRSEDMPGIEPGSPDPKSSPLPLRQQGGRQDLKTIIRKTILWYL